MVGSHDLDEIGIVYDFKKLKSLLNKIIDKLDHQYLNDISPFDILNPTSENVAKYIFDSLKGEIPENIKVLSVEVGESEKYKAVYEE